VNNIKSYSLFPLNNLYTMK